MDNLIKILTFLNKIEKLKTIKRKVSVSDNSRKESPAEHTWRMAVMAIVLHKELKLKINLLKTLEIILVHDIVEAVADDVWILDSNDKNAHETKKQKELLAAEEIYSLLPHDTGEELKSLWLEFENSTSQEAKFAYAIDRIEVIIQRNDLGAKNWERNDIYPVLMYWADDSVGNFPELKPLWQLVQKELTKQRKS